MTTSTSCRNEGSKTITLTASCTFDCREPQVLINNMTLSQLTARPNEKRTGEYFKNLELNITCYHVDDGEGNCPPLGYTECSDDSMYDNITYSVSGEWVVGNTTDSCIYNFSCDNGIVDETQMPYDKVTKTYILKECQTIPFPQCQNCPSSNITSNIETLISSDIDVIIETISTIAPSYSNWNCPTMGVTELTQTATTTITSLIPVCTTTAVTTPCSCDQTLELSSLQLSLTTSSPSPMPSVTASAQGAAACTLYIVCKCI